MPDPIIEVSSLVKRYRGAEINAVDGISFQVQPGDFFALLGPNGAGKTTTISILTTTLAPSSGQVRIAGFDIGTQSGEVRRQVGIIFQRPSLDRNLTGEENVRLHAILYGLHSWRPSFRLMPRAYRAQVRELAELLGLGPEIFKPVRRMSGGMMRKLEILRSLLHHPRVLFLDEPTAGLDPVSRRNLWEYLRGVRKQGDTTVFLTTHYLEEAEEADTICILTRGRIESYGSPESVKSELLGDHLLIGAAAGDRSALGAELKSLGLDYQNDEAGRLLRVPLHGKNAHQLLRSIETPLTVLRTQAPSLEDAYLEIVGRASLDES